MRPLLMIGALGLGMVDLAVLNVRVVPALMQAAEAELLHQSGTGDSLVAAASRQPDQGDERASSAGHPPGTARNSWVQNDRRVTSREKDSSDASLPSRVGVRDAGPSQQPPTAADAPSASRAGPARKGNAKAVPQSTKITSDSIEPGRRSHVREGRRVSPDVQQRGRLLGTVSFGFGHAEVRAMARRPLAELARELASRPDGKVLSLGHSDDIGSEAVNLQLGLDRARDVAQTLIELGVPASRIVVESAGESEPRAAPDSPAGRRKNRRVELYWRGE